MAGDQDKSKKTRIRKSGPQELISHPDFQLLVTARKRTMLAKRSSVRKRGRQSKYAWEAARDYFMSSDENVSLKQVSDEFGIPYDYLRSKASQERWTYARAQEQARIYKMKRQKHLQRMADDSIRFDQTAIDAARLGITLVTSRLAEIAQIHGANKPVMDNIIARLKNGEPVTRQELYSVINYKELRELAQAGVLFQDMGRKAFGVDTTQIEISGPGGEAIEQVISVGAEMGKDDPKRLAAFLEALERTGAVKLNIEQKKQSKKGLVLIPEDDPNVVDAEVVSENGNGHNPSSAPGKQETKAIASGPELTTDKG